MRPVNEDVVDIVLDHWFTYESNPDPSWPSTIRRTLRAIEDAGYRIVNPTDLLNEHAEAIAEARWNMENDNADNVCAALVALVDALSRRDEQAPSSDVGPIA